MKISLLIFILFVSNVLITYADIAADSSENYTNGVGITEITKGLDYRIA